MLENKDLFLSKVSSYLPDLTFFIHGDGEEHGDLWSER